MDVPKRLLAVPLLAVLLPCVAVAVLGYMWLRIEGDTQLLRGRDAAQAEADYPLDWISTGEIFFYRPNYAASGRRLLPRAGRGRRRAENPLRHRRRY